MTIMENTDAKPDKIDPVESTPGEKDPASTLARDSDEEVRNPYLEAVEESGTTHLSAEEFDAFVDKVLHPDVDPEVRAARKRIMSFLPVWEK